MTQNDFAALCEQYLIAPAIALENPRIIAALKAKDRLAVEAALKEDF